MTIKIQTQQDYIPVNLGDLELKFYITDESVLKIKNGAESTQKELQELSNKANKNNVTDEEYIELSKETLRKGFALFFEEDTFDKIYKISPSVVICIQYFSQISEALLKEMDKKMGNTSKQKLEKYLQNKNKK